MIVLHVDGQGRAEDRPRVRRRADHPEDRVQSVVGKPIGQESRAGRPNGGLKRAANQQTQADEPERQRRAQQHHGGRSDRQAERDQHGRG